MSRIGRLGLLAAVGALLSPSIAHAQQTAQELIERLDELRPQVEEAREAHRAFTRGVEAARLAAAEAAANQDTVQVGLIRIVTVEEQVETARELFTKVWDEHYSDVRQSAGLERTTFVFQWAKDRAPLHVTAPSQRIEHNRFIPRFRVEEQIRAAIGAAISFDLSATQSNVGEWVSAVAFGNYDVPDIYRELATTGSIATRGCMEGDVSRCELALGLGDQGTDVAAWYTPEERRALVGRNPVLGARREAQQAWDACVRHGQFDECDELLSDRRARWAPLSPTTRASLLSLALETGGAGSWGRLLDDPEMSAEEALERASGLPLSTLVAEWRTSIIEGRPEVYEGFLPKSGSSLAWTLLFAALAMRSTRWRLG